MFIVFLVFEPKFHVVSLLSYHVWFARCACHLFSNIMIAIIEVQNVNKKVLIWFFKGLIDLNEKQDFKIRLIIRTGYLELQGQA